MSQSGEQPHASGVGGLFGFRRPPRQSAPGADGDVSGPGRATYDRESEKRLAKLLKKARPFFDEKLKPKARLQALYTFLEAAQSAQDHDLLRRFIGEHDATVFSVMSDALWHQMDKIRAIVAKTPDRPPHVGTSASHKAADKDSKEVGDLFKILNVLRALLLYSGDKVGKGWQRANFAAIFQMLLHSGNHIRLRTEGLRLLLLWLNDQDSETLLAAQQPRSTGIDHDLPREMVRMYRDAVSLGVFLPCWDLPEPRAVAVSDGAGGIYDEKGLGTVEQLRIGANDSFGPLIPAVIQPGINRVAQQRAESIDLLEEIVYNIVLLARAASESVDSQQPAAPSAAIPAAESPTSSKRDVVGSIPNSPKLKNGTPGSSASSSDSALASSVEDLAEFERTEEDELAARALSLQVPAARNLRMMWELFTQSYLRLLFPGIARKFGLVVAEGEGFGTCPPDVLQLLLVFLLRAVANTLSPAAMRQANEILASIGAMATPPGTNYRVDYGIPAGTGNVLKQMLLGSEGSLEMFHEAIRQSMMVPWRYHEVISLSLGLLKCWLFVDPLERPLHVRTKPRPFSAAPTSLFLPPLDAVLGSAGAAPSKAPQPAAAPKESESRLLYFLPRYIRYVRLIFLERKEPGDLEARLAKYREALVFLRATAMESFFTLDTTCWQTLLTSLLEIHRQTVLTKSEPYSLFGSTRNGDEFVGMVVETLLVSWIRSKTDDSRLWKSLYDQMSNANSTRYGRTVYEWARLMGKLTKALAQLCLHVDLDQYAAEAEGTLGRRRVFSSAGGSRPTPSAHDSSLPPTISSSPDPDKKLSAKNRATSTEVLSERSSRAASGNSGQPPRLSDFGSVQSLALTTQTAMFAWKNVLCILGNPNSIQSPIIQADAVKAAVNIYDMLALIRACQPYKGVPLPPMYDFITWIFQACAMSPEYAEGRAAAYGCVCRMLCRRHDHRMGDELFAHFYQLVIRGLAGSDLSIIFAIVNNATRLFGLQLPGSDVLIVPFLRCFRRLFFGDHRLSSFNPTEVPQRASDASQSIPEIVRQNAAIILSSIAAMCNKAPEGSCPILNFAEGPQKVAGERPNATELAAIVDHGQEMPLDRHEGELPLVEAKGMVKNLIFGLLQDNTVSQRLDDRATSHRYLLNAACSLAYEELVLVVKLDRTLVEECLNVLLGHLHQHNLPAVNAAVDCLNLFSQSFPHLSRLDGNAAFGVVEKIVGAIQEHLAANPPSRNQELIRACIVARLFYCLLDWLLCVPSKWFHNTRFVQLVFDTIEAGLSEGGPPPGSGKLRRNGPPSDGKNRRTPRVGEDSSSDIAKSGSQLSLDEDGNDQETSLIRDAAENVLMHVLHHVDNFPPTNGPAMMNTSILDPAFEGDMDPSKTLYFSYNEKTLLAFVEMPGKTPLDSKVRIIVRDIAGRYCWDAWLFYESLDKIRSVLEGTDPFADPESPPPSYLGIVEKLIFSEEITVEPRTRKITPERPAPGTMALPPPGDPDMLKELLRAIGDRSPDCLRIPGRSLLEPEPVPEDQQAEVAEQAAMMSFQIEQEEPILRHYEYPRRNDTEAPGVGSDLGGQFEPVRPPKPVRTILPFHRTRQLLTQLGFVNFDSLRESSFHMLTKSPALFRDIKGLDKTAGRETIKVAVVYVGPGQEDEGSILRNERTSPDYAEFVQSLGWEVDLATHAGYLGGLERNQTSGERAAYFCNSTLEIIYHEVTRLPTDAHDPRQVRKKRHIGNDPVHVIWNEHARDYRRNTISGDYANAQIVITPQGGGFYTVDITRDPKLPPFGPLQPHSVVSKAALGALVRATCVAAHRYTLQGIADRLDLYRHAYAQRVADLKMIRERHASKNWTYQQFLRFLMAVET